MEIRIKENTKQCRKCENLFVCNADDITLCGCSQVRLSEETITFLSNTYFGCLCNSCLKKIDADIQKATNLPFPTNKSMFVKGHHYYLENGFWVFTELYHTLRGNCCKSGCRHCVYGFKKN